MDKVKRTDAEWRELLTPEEYAVLRQAGTEAPFTGEYTDTKTEGVYRCRACGAELFRSDAKFESHCGWPSFYQPSESDAVVLIEDRTLGMARTEVRCAALRLPPGPRVHRRRLRRPHRPALVHQLGVAQAGARGRVVSPGGAVSLRLITADSLSSATAQTGGMLRSAAISGDLVGARALWMGRTVVLPGTSSGDHHHGAVGNGHLRGVRPPGVRLPRPGERIAGPAGDSAGRLRVGAAARSAPGGESRPPIPRPSW